MIMVDDSGRIHLVNAQTEEMFGYPRAELIGKPVEMLLPVRYQASHAARRRGFFAAPQRRLMGEGRDLFGRHKDGREFPIEIGLNPLVTSDRTFVLSTVIDITERRRPGTSSSGMRPSSSRRGTPRSVPCARSRSSSPT